MKHIRDLKPELTKGLPFLGLFWRHCENKGAEQSLIADIKAWHFDRFLFVCNLSANLVSPMFPPFQLASYLLLTVIRGCR